MNKQKLRSFMLLNGDTYKSLSDYLGISKSTFSSKINETNNCGFTQKEIVKIKIRYNLTSENIDDIFFNNKVS